jgi:hypothetical protein
MKSIIGLICIVGWVASVVVLVELLARRVERSGTTLKVPRE